MALQHQVKTQKVELTNGIVVRAVKLTVSNIIKVSNWIGERSDKDVVVVTKVNKDGDVVEWRLKLGTPHGPRVARIGQYIFRSDVNPGQFFVLKDDQVAA